MANKKPEYDQIKDGGAFVYVSGAAGNLMCCDCGLVHNTRITIADDDHRLISIEMRRDARKTAAARKRLEGALQNNEKGATYALIKMEKKDNDRTGNESSGVHAGESTDSGAEDRR